ncbi:MAG: cysteine dioxygenase family protein [Phycisphaerales bacterium]|nr:cysteine dioxygenase family protein [Phycisphaerales bacterium]
MTTKARTIRPRELIDYLDGLTERATVPDLLEKLAALDITLDTVADYAQFSDEQYARNLVREGPWYHLLVLCWRSGQRSPIHNHAGSTCGVRVLSGVCTETTFEQTPSGFLKAVASTDLACGQVSASQDSDTHQVSNLQAHGHDLVTLHIYSPPLLRMDTFSLIDGSVGEFRPVITEHIHGCGI